MYVGRRLRYSEVVPICAMEEDILSGQTVCPGHFAATEKAVFFIELAAGWELEQGWMFWRKDSSLAPSKI
jgi:hypothetical protein